MVGINAVTAGVGPVIGGWLIENVSWRSVFFINVPLALIVLLISFLHVPESRDDDSNAALDWQGVVLATVGLGMVVYGLIESSRLGFGRQIVLTTIIAARSPSQFSFTFNRVQRIPCCRSCFFARAILAAPIS